MAFRCRVRSLQKAKATAKTLFNIILGWLHFSSGLGFLEATNTASECHATFRFVIALDIYYISPYNLELSLNYLLNEIMNTNNCLNKSLVYLNTHIPSVLKNNSLFGNILEIAEKIAMVVIYPFVWLAAKAVNLCLSNRVIVQSVSKTLPLQPFEFGELVPELQRHVFGFLTLQEKCQLLFSSKVMKDKFEMNVDLEKNNLQKVLSHPNLLEQLQYCQNDTRLFLKCISESIDYEALPTFCIKNLFKAILTFASPEQIANFLGPIVMKQDFENKLPSTKLTQIFFQELNSSSLKHLLSIPNCLDFLLPLCAADLVRDRSYYRLDFFDKIINLAFENDPHNHWWLNIIGVHKIFNEMSDYHKILSCVNAKYQRSFVYLSLVVLPHYITKSDDSSFNELIIEAFKTVIKNVGGIFIPHFASVVNKTTSKDEISDLEISFIFKKILIRQDDITTHFNGSRLINSFHAKNYVATWYEEVISPELINTKEKSVNYIKEQFKTKQLTDEFKSRCLQLRGDLSAKDHLLQLYNCKYGQKTLQKICKKIKDNETAFYYVKVITESKLPTEAISIYLRAITPQDVSIKAKLLAFSSKSIFLLHKNQSFLPSIFSHFNLEFDDYPPIPDSAWDPEESIESLVNKIALET